MTTRRLGLLVGLAALAALGARAAYAVDKHDFFDRPDTLAVALTGGDSETTYSVTCNIAAATQLRAAVTDRSRRRICFENRGNLTVAFGSSTVIASDLYVLGESTNAATSPIYCTNSSAAFFCGTTLGTSSMTVVVSEEIQSIP